MIWDYAIGQDSIKIEMVKDNEVVALIVELPVDMGEVAEIICNAHNDEYSKGYVDGRLKTFNEIRDYAARLDKEQP